MTSTLHFNQGYVDLTLQLAELFKDVEGLNKYYFANKEEWKRIERESPGEYQRLIDGMKQIKNNLLKEKT